MQFSPNLPLKGTSASNGTDYDFVVMVTNGMCKPCRIFSNFDESGVSRHREDFWGFWLCLADVSIRFPCSPILMALSTSKQYSSKVWKIHHVLSRFHRECIASKIVLSVANLVVTSLVSEPFIRGAMRRKIPVPRSSIA